MTRQAGHTTAMLEGANNTDEPIIVAANEMHAQWLKKTCKNKTAQFVSLNNLTDKLRGTNRPLLFDNHTLHLLFEAMLAEFDQSWLYNENQELKTQIRAMKEILK